MMFFLDKMKDIR